MRYEIWRYSVSWKKWIRDVYTSEEMANKRYERLKAQGKQVRSPQPLSKRMPLAVRLANLLSKPK